MWYSKQKEGKLLMKNDEIKTKLNFSFTLWKGKKTSWKIVSDSGGGGGDGMEIQSISLNGFFFLNIWCIWVEVNGQFVSCHFPMDFSFCSAKTLNRESFCFFFNFSFFLNYSVVEEFFISPFSKQTTIISQRIYISHLFKYFIF